MRRSVGSAAILAICLAYCSQGPFVFTDLDVNDPKARSLIETASRSELRVDGLSEPPKAGKITLGRPRSSAEDVWDASISLSVFWSAGKRSGEWDFTNLNGNAELVWWTEWQLSPFLVSSPTVADGQQYYEQLHISSGTGGSCGDNSGFVVEHWSAQGIQEISLEMVPSIEEEWESRESAVKH